MAFITTKYFRLISRRSKLLFGPFNDFSPVHIFFSFLIMDSMALVRITKTLKYLSYVTNVEAVRI